MIPLAVQFASSECFLLQYAVRHLVVPGRRVRRTVPRAQSNITGFPKFWQPKKDFGYSPLSRFMSRWCAYFALDQFGTVLGEISYQFHIEYVENYILDQSFCCPQEPWASGLLVAR